MWMPGLRAQDTGNRARAERAGKVWCIKDGACVYVRARM